MFESLASCFTFRCSASLYMTRIAVTFALPAESSQFLRRLRSKSRADRNGIRIVRGTIDDRGVEVLYTGVGEKICRERIGKFLQDAQFHILISTGFAGALNNRLHVNDLLLAQNFSTVDLKQTQASLSALSVRTADLLTLPAPIDSSEERERIAHESGTTAADMETEFIAQACAAHGIPLLSLRVITDTPLQPFPAPPSVLFDIAKQRTNLAKLTKFFVTHPHHVPRLVEFARRIARAKKVLAHALATIVRQL
jgi:adenosylhomocysteine nucleosidase